LNHNAIKRETVPKGKTLSGWCCKGGQSPG
jgi:hypothetical protein